MQEFLFHFSSPIYLVAEKLQRDDKLIKKTRVPYFLRMIRDSLSGCDEPGSKYAQC
jgi:hypothetical protein